MRKKSKIRKMLGSVKIWQSRLAGYVSMLNFAMILYLYIIESPFGMEWYHWVLLLVVGCAVIIYVDIKYIFPSANLYTFNKNPGWMSIKKQAEENDRKLNLIMKHLGIEDGDAERKG